jgi:hypothetical protein
MKIHVLLITALSFTAAATFSATLDTNRIEQVTGLKGAWSAAEGVFKVTAPRNDLPVSVDGWKMPPFMGLASWAAFRSVAMVTGSTFDWTSTTASPATKHQRLFPIVRKSC